MERNGYYMYMKPSRFCSKEYLEVIKLRHGSLENYEQWKKTVDRASNLLEQDNIKKAIQELKKRNKRDSTYIVGSDVLSSDLEDCHLPRHPSKVNPKQ